MSINDIKKIIKNRRIELGLTMLEVSKAVGVSEATVSRWESGNIENMKLDKVSLLAKVLKLPPSVIMGWEELETEAKNNYDRFLFEEQLKQLGCSIGFYEEDAYLWINYPDGTLEITMAQLNELINSSKYYLKFQLEEFKQKNINSFRANK